MNINYLAVRNSIIKVLISAYRESPDYKMLLSILLFANIGIKSFGQWHSIPSGTKMNLNAVRFINSKTGYIVGDKGTVLKTTDDGKAWSNSVIDSNTNLYSISFPSSQTGYVSGYKTTDGGGNWSILNTANGAFTKLCKYYFKNDTVGYEWSILIINQIGKTINGGTNWNFFKLPESQCVVHQIVFTDDSTGFAVGDYPPMINKTINGGKTWSMISDSFSLQDIVFPNKN